MELFPGLQFTRVVCFAEIQLARQRSRTEEHDRTIRLPIASSREPITQIALDPFDSPFSLGLPSPDKPRAVAAKRPPLLPTDLTRRLLETEEDLLRAALEKSRFNQRMAADLLGLSYHQFRGRMRKFDIAAKP